MSPGQQPVLSAVFPCAGSGSRFSREQPGTKKQFLLLGGIPVFLHSLKRFAETGSFREMILVIDLQDLETFEGFLSEKYLQEKNLPPVLAKTKLVSGGAERHLSVYAGLKEVPHETGMVFIHDAARPLISVEDLKDLIELSGGAWEKDEGILPAEAVKDTIKRVRVENGETYVSESLPRQELAAVSTPQVFPLLTLKKAFEPFLESKSAAPTDEGEIFFQAKGRIKIHFLGKPNPKLTTAEDLVFIESLYQKNLRSQP